ncbi:MAG: hypothetical protein HOP27_04445 [Anaerolineales bacterium]|nr:hypothetical protein [Anaerolineales bacterium]
MLPRMKLASIFLLLALVLSFMPAGVAVGHVSAATCYSARFISDVNVPDGTSFSPGEAFTKTWKIQNNGTCEWSAVSLVFDSGEKMSAPSPAATLPTVAINATVNIDVKLVAPTSPGTYTGYFKLESAGQRFGIGSTANSAFWVKIVVKTGGTSGGVTTTAYDFTANAASATWTSGTGALTFPGTDGNANGFGLKFDNPRLEDNKDYAQAGLLFAPNNASNGFIQAVYPEFTVQSGDRFQARIGCELNATNCYVAYRLQYQIAGSSDIKTFWKEPPFRERYEGNTYFVDQSLSSLAGKNIKFILSVSAYNGSAAGDRAVWLNPRITRTGSGGPTPTFTPTVTGTPPTPTPTTTAPPPASCTDRALFIKDVTVIDGTTFAPNAAFQKTWRFRNIGTCTWTTAYQLIFESGDKMGGPDAAPLTVSVAPNKEVDISINLTAPATAGTYKGNWKFKNNNGVPFGLVPFGIPALGNQKAFWVEIKVSGVPVTATFTPTPTPTPTSTPPTAYPNP